MSGVTYLPVLYEMALLLSSEIESRRLIKKLMQKLLFHTGFPCGMFLEYATNEVQAGGDIKVRISAGLGGQGVANLEDSYIDLPARILSDRAELIDLPAEIAAWSDNSRYKQCLVLPVPDYGAFWLLATERTRTTLPLTQLFSTVLGNFSRTLGLLRKNEAQKASLAESKSMLQAVFDTIPVRVFWKDLQGNYLGGNQLFAEDAGVDDPEKLTGMMPSEMPWAHLYQNFSNADEKVVSGESSLLIQEFHLKTASGKEMDISTSRVPLRNHKGEIVGVLGAYNDITERKHMMDELIHARELAEQGSKAKSEFLSNMSHELRTPLNAIIGFTQLLEANRQGNLDDEQLDELGEISRAGHHLLSLINEMLDLARVESGKMQLSMESVNIEDAVNECISLIKPVAEQHGVEVAACLEQADNVYVYADFLRLKQVLLNLISNAIKYNRHNGKVTINHEQLADSAVRIRVNDTGQGLTAEEIDRLFRPFERLDMDERKIEGTGIGLVLTRHIVEMMNGHMGVECFKGQGCSFWIELQPASSLSDRIRN